MRPTEPLFWRGQLESETLAFVPTPDPEAIAKTATAFLNQQGGRILVGVDASGKPLGLVESGIALSRTYREIARISPSAAVSVEVFPVGDQNVLLVTAPRGPETPYVYGDAIYMRQGVVTRPALPHEISRLILHRAEEPTRWEARSLPNASLQDIDLARLMSIAHIHDETTSPSLFAVLLDLLNNPETTNLGAIGLGYLGDHRAIEPLLTRLQAEEDDLGHWEINRSLEKLLPSLGIELLLDRLQNEKNRNIRKAIVRALGNLGDHRPIEPLLTRLEDKEDRGPTSEIVTALGKLLPYLGLEPLLNRLQTAKDRYVRRAIIRALGNLGDHRATEPLLSRLSDKEDRGPTSEIVTALGNLGDHRATEPILTRLQTEESRVVRRAIIRALGNLGDHRATEPLLSRLSDKEDRGPTSEIVTALGKLLPSLGIELLLARLQNEKNDDVCKAVIKAIGTLGDHRATEPLLSRLSDKEDRGPTSEIVTALGKLLPSLGIELLLARLQNEKNDDVCKAVIRAIGTLGHHRAIEPLLTRLQIEEDEYIRWEIVTALGNLGDHRAIEPLLNRFQTENDEDVREAIVEALGKIGRRLNEEAIQPESAWQQLERLNLTENALLRNDAIVLLGKKPARFFPQTRIRAVCFVDETRRELADTRLFEGHLFRQLEQAEGFLRAHLPIAARMPDAGLYRQENAALPWPAIRESLINALVHRDYSSFDGSVQILVFPDRLEIWNPGGLLPGFTIDDLTRGTVSRPRNPDMLHVLYLCGLVERIGQGCLFIQRECLRAGLLAPQWREESAGLRLTLYREKQKSTEDEQVPLSERQRAYLLALSPGATITSSDYRQAVASELTDRSARNHLAALVADGWLLVEGTGRNTRYRRTEKSK